MATVAASPSLPSSSWLYPRLLAHRGGGCLAPENTLVALDAGAACGYRAAEFDVALSADEVPVLLHDESLERTTDGTGSVASRSAAELARLDAGSWFDARFAGERLPSLQQALQHCRERGIWLNIEIKPVPGHEARTGAVVAETVAAFYAPASGAGVPPTLPPLLSSFAPAALQAARAAAPGLRRGLLYGRLPRNWQQALEALEAYSLHCDHRTLTRAQAQAIRRAGFGLLCYTVNEPQRVDELRDWGVDACCTDRIDLIRPEQLGR